MFLLFPSHDRAQGTKAQRPGAPVSGDLRLNTDDSRLEFYNGTDWKRLSETAGTPTPDFQADFLVVAGGGGAGGVNSGGGGAGGLRTSYGSTSGGGASNESKFNASFSTSYTVTVGAGGAGVSQDVTANGNDSVFASITSTAGGGSGNRAYQEPQTGGSGGGGAASNDSRATGAAGTANQGFAGGNGNG